LGIVGLFLYMKINETEPVVPAGVAEWGDLDTLGNVDIGGAGDIANVDIDSAPAETAITADTSSAAAPTYGASADTSAAAPPSYESAPAFTSDRMAQAPPAFVPETTEPATTAASAPVTEDRYAQSLAPATTPAVPETNPTDSKLPPLPALPVAAAGAIAGAAANELTQPEPPVAQAPTGPIPTDTAVQTQTASPAPAVSSPVPHVSTPADNATAATATPAPAFPTTEPTTTPTESLEADKQTTAGQASLFSAARVAVQSALDRGELSQALLLLSDWYGDPSLSSAEATEVQELLSQLAGSVIYSTEHRLEPPYMVQAGEKLTDIAEKYNIPWQLLAKINGITNPDQLQTGQQLKVIRGPFSARIDLSERKLVLMLDRRYAGQFALDFEPTTSIEEGYWSVNQKLLTPGSVGMINPTGGTLSEERSILLTSTTGGNGQVTVLRGPGATTPATTDPTGRVIQLRGTDVEDVYDILSLGSQVVIRR
jgi:LysM repeat protein